MKRPVLKTRLGFASYAALLLLALTASNAWAERPCLEEGIDRTCDPDECVALQDIVNAYCKPFGAGSEPTRCEELIGLPSSEVCQALEQAKDNWQDCESSRGDINDRCWNGGDLGHQIAQANAGEQVRACENFISVICGNPCD